MSGESLVGVLSLAMLALGGCCVPGQGTKVSLRVKKGSDVCQSIEFPRPWPAPKLWPEHYTLRFRRLSMGGNRYLVLGLEVGQVSPEGPAKPMDYLWKIPLSSPLKPEAATRSEWEDAEEIDWDKDFAHLRQERTERIRRSKVKGDVGYWPDGRWASTWNFRSRIEFPTVLGDATYLGDFRFEIYETASGATVATVGGSYCGGELAWPLKIWIDVDTFVLGVGIEERRSLVLCRLDLAQGK